MTHDDDDLDGRIAVIGMSGRFPGAGDLATFWTNLHDGVESIRYFDEDELIAAGESIDNIRDPSYVPAAASLDGLRQLPRLSLGPRMARGPRPSRRASRPG